MRARQRWPAAMAAATVGGTILSCFTILMVPSLPARSLSSRTGLPLMANPSSLVLPQRSALGRYRAKSFSSRRHGAPVLCAREKDQPVAKKGDVVEFHYSFADAETGEVFVDSVEIGEQMKVLLGGRRIIPILDSALVGMREGETKTTVFKPGEAFGEYKKNKIIEVSLQEIPNDVSEGAIIEVSNGSDIAKILKIDPDKAVLDFNNPLAGRPTRLVARLVSIEPGPEPITELSMKTLEDGDGVRQPQMGDAVYIHYEAKLTDGILFHSSEEYEGGAPFGFILQEGTAIEGVIWAVQQMTTGQRVELKVPSRYAYGEVGLPGSLPPNVDLIFDLRLVDITTENQNDIDGKLAAHMAKQMEDTGMDSTPSSEVDDTFDDYVRVKRGPDGELEVELGVEPTEEEEETLKQIQSQLGDDSGDIVYDPTNPFRDSGNDTPTLPSDIPLNMLKDSTSKTNDDGIDSVPPKK